MINYEDKKLNKDVIESINNILPDDYEFDPETKKVVLKKDVLDSFNKKRFSLKGLFYKIFKRNKKEEKKTKKENVFKRIYNRFNTNKNADLDSLLDTPINTKHKDEVSIIKNILNNVNVKDDNYVNVIRKFKFINKKINELSEENKDRLKNDKEFENKYSEKLEYVVELGKVKFENNIVILENNYKDLEKEEVLSKIEQIKNSYKLYIRNDLIDIYNSLFNKEMDYPNLTESLKILKNVKDNIEKTVVKEEPKTKDDAPSKKDVSTTNIFKKPKKVLPSFYEKITNSDFISEVNNQFNEYDSLYKEIRKVKEKIMDYDEFLNTHELNHPDDAKLKENIQNNVSNLKVKYEELKQENSIDLKNERIAFYTQIAMNIDKRIEKTNLDRKVLLFNYSQTNDTKLIDESLNKANEIKELEKIKEACLFRKSKEYIYFENKGSQIIHALKR